MGCLDDKRHTIVEYKRSSPEQAEAFVRALRRHELTDETRTERNPLRFDEVVASGPAAQLDDPGRLERDLFKDCGGSDRARELEGRHL
jgi:hypothetical protein